MASVEEPPYLTVGTDVSAKYKGAFCEAKITDVNKHVKLRVLFDGGSGTFLIDDTDLKTGSTLETGTRIEAKHPEKKQQTYVQATITKILDHSRYTVVFDDGDQCVLRRNSLCLKSGKHFAESETLDQLPLTNPEHFGNPVKVGAIEQLSNSNKVQLNNHHQPLDDKPKGKSSPSTATNSSTTSEETKFNINNGESNNNRKRQQPPDFNNDNIKKMKKERNVVKIDASTSNSGRRGATKGRKRRESINNGSKQAVELDDVSMDSSQDSGDATPIESNVKFDQIEVGVKLMVQYGKGKVQNVYEAKVNKIETNSTGRVKYFVHYTGWNNRYDEWITRNRILSIVTEKENGSKDGRSKQSEIAQSNQPAVSASSSSSSLGTSSVKEKDKERTKEKERDKEKDKEREKERDKEEEKEKDKDRDKDKEKDREKPKDKEKAKEKEKEREVPTKTRRSRQAEVTVSSVTSNSANSCISSTTALITASSTSSSASTTTVSTSNSTDTTSNNSSSSASNVPATKDKEKEIPSKTRRSRQLEPQVPVITSTANIVSSCSTSSSTTSISSTTTSSVVSTSSSTTTPSTITNQKETSPIKSRRSKQYSEAIAITESTTSQIATNIPVPPETPVKEKQGKQLDNKLKEKSTTLKTRRSARPIRKKEFKNIAFTSSVQAGSSSDDDAKKSGNSANNNSSSSCAGSADELSQDNDINNPNLTEPSSNLTSHEVKPILKQAHNSNELDEKLKHEISLDDSTTNVTLKSQVAPPSSSKSPAQVSHTLDVDSVVTDSVKPKQDLDEKTSLVEQTLSEQQHQSDVLASPSSRPIYKFCEDIEESDCDKKISILQERIMALRQTYNSLKTELNDLDRRRKRPRTERMNSETSNCSVACRN